MPRDPKRNIQSYQLQGGNLNEFEFQKSQSEMAEESDLPPAAETDNPNLSQAERVLEVVAEAHKKVAKRRKLGVAKAWGKHSKAAGRKSATKAARNSTKKNAKSAGTKKRATVKGRQQKLAASR
jgi:hypothetical protein